ncbi:MAG: NTP transferase domain-containing protein [Solobacterium sp.]|nr:NTP transferase domain-containing protein [Solobacterium sp.]
MKHDKAKLVWHDQSFLEIICAKIRRMAMPRYVSLASTDEQIPSDFIALKDEVCDENGGFIGPLGGIYTGLKQCVRDGLDGIYTVPVDLPLFETELFDLIAKAEETALQADIYILVSSDGRMHPATGYYRSSVISTAEVLINNHDYRLMSLIRHPDLKTVFVPTENAQQDRMLFNVNSPADYETLTKKAEHRIKHIVLQGDKGAGKSTLIRRLAQEMQCTAGGFLTRAVMSRKTGYKDIFMYPASFIFDTDDQGIIARENGKLCGITQNGVKEVYPEVFDTYGTQLIHSASKKQLIIMDEIGFMEEKAQQFQKAVLSAFDGTVPVLASVKAKNISTPFLEEVRSHENVRLIELNETNRDEVYEQLVELYTDRKEDPR